MQRVRPNAGQERRQGGNQGTRCAFRDEGLREGGNCGTGATCNAGLAMSSASGLPAITVVVMMMAGVVHA